MKGLLQRLCWAMLDPILLRITHRLEHIQRHQKMELVRQRALQHAILAPTVILGSETIIANVGERDRLRIGAYTYVCGELSVVDPQGSIIVGEYCFVGQQSRIWSQKKIRIGNHVLISHLVDIHDTNSHTLNWSQRREDTIQHFRCTKTY